MCLKSGAKVSTLKISDVLFSVFQHDHIFFLLPSPETHLMCLIGLKVFLTSSDWVSISPLCEKGQLPGLGL